MSSQLVHSWPVWTLGPRSAHPKFGGNVILGGIKKVKDRLIVIHENFPDDLSSLHIPHELRTLNPAYRAFNSPLAIGWKNLVAGIRDGYYPEIAGVTAAMFGWKGVENGALLSEDNKVKQMAIDWQIEAIERSQYLKAEGLGKGIVIWWPAWDSFRQYHGKQRQHALTSNEAVDMLVDIWCDILERTNGEVWLEWKPEVPGKDYINSIKRAIAFANKVNQRLGRIAVHINNEWAHLLIGGTTVEEGTDLTIKAGLFTGFFHANSADLADVCIDDDTGEVVYGAPSDDKDWYVGAGSQEMWEDQQAAVKLMLEYCGAEKVEIIAEHDIDPAGDDPLEYYSISRSNLEKMLEQ